MREDYGIHKMRLSYTMESISPDKDHSFKISLAGTHSRDDCRSYHRNRTSPYRAESEQRGCRFSRNDGRVASIARDRRAKAIGDQ